MKKWRRDSGEHPLLLELPSYRLPHPRDLLLGLWERAMIFLRRVGGVILAMTVLLWFLLSYPGMPEGATGAAVDYSFAGRIGHVLALLFAPIGFDWRSEEHTSELQSLMRIAYAVFCLKKKTKVTPRVR